MRPSRESLLGPPGVPIALPDPCIHLPGGGFQAPRRPGGFPWPWLDPGAGL